MNNIERALRERGATGLRRHGETTLAGSLEIEGAGIPRIVARVEAQTMTIQAHFRPISLTQMSRSAVTAYLELLKRQLQHEGFAAGLEGGVVWMGMQGRAGDDALVKTLVAAARAALPGVDALCRESKLAGVYVEMVVGVADQPGQQTTSGGDQ